MIDEQEKKLREVTEQYFDSEVLRALVMIFFTKTDLLTKRAQSMASMGVARLVKNGVDIEQFK